MNQKQAIIDALRAFVNQRPGFEFANYGDVASYRSDSRKAAKDKAIALQLLRDIELRDSITADAILAECGGGRVQILCIVTDTPKGAHWYETAIGDYCTVKVDYCTGQYFPTEFRAAIARLCVSVLWTWKREHAMPAEPLRDAQGDTVYRYNGKDVSAGDWLRASFRREYGRTIADRFFS